MNRQAGAAQRRDEGTDGRENNEGNDATQRTRGIKMYMV